MEPQNIRISDYTYTLPGERIAKYPLPERDASKLLIYQNGNISEDVYRNIAAHLPANSLLVFNNTRVIEARLLFQKPTGGIIEIFCLEPADDHADVSIAMQQQQKVLWKCMIGGASKWKHGMVPEKKINFLNEEVALKAAIIDRLADSFIVELSWNPPDHSFAEILHHAGEIPLPPYIKRAAEKTDSERYQTIYAREDGSVAAPTAGLHFTPAIFEKLDRKNIKTSFVTLHVGAGTFKPVKSATIADHEMHSEWIEVDRQMLQYLVDNETIVAVGTTSLRTLETLYWLGIKLMEVPDIEQEDLHLQQWEAYTLPSAHPVNDALQALLQWMAKKQINKLITRTQLLMVPGYQLRIADALVTNFHQPQSTLLLLVAAIAGPEWKKIYEFALENDFRFLSYGDGCLIYPQSPLSGKEVQ